MHARIVGHWSTPRGAGRNIALARLELGVRRGLSERSVPGFTLFLDAVGTEERIGVFADSLEAVTIEVTLTTNALDLLHEVIVTRPLFLDELPQLGILSG